jgi:hypothetical protein
MLLELYLQFLKNIKAIFPTEDYLYDAITLLEQRSGNITVKEIISAIEYIRWDIRNHKEYSDKFTAELERIRYI